MAHVLVTGSAGTVGRPLCEELARRGHAVRAFDLAPTPDAADAIVGDVADASAVHAAMSGVDAVVHLAAQPHERPFPELVGPNVVGLYNVMDAAREQAVKRVVLASSMMVVAGGWIDPVRPAGVDERRPNKHYALTKVWAEQMGDVDAIRFEIVYAASRGGERVFDMEPARRLLGFEAAQRWPEGLPFPLGDG